MDQMVEIRAAQAIPQLAAPPPQPKPILPYFTKYNEKDDLDTWFYTVEAKLYIDGRAISNLEA